MSIDIVTIYAVSYGISPIQTIEERRGWERAKNESDGHKFAFSTVRNGVDCANGVWRVVAVELNNHILVMCRAPHIDCKILT